MPSSYGGKTEKVPSTLERHAFVLGTAELPQPDNVVQPREVDVAVKDQVKTPQIPPSTEEGKLLAQYTEMRKRLC